MDGAPSEGLQLGEKTASSRPHGSLRQGVMVGAGWGVGGGGHGRLRLALKATSAADDVSTVVLTVAVDVITGADATVIAGVIDMVSAVIITTAAAILSQTATAITIISATLR